MASSLVDVVFVLMISGFIMLVGFCLCHCVVDAQQLAPAPAVDSGGGHHEKSNSDADDDDDGITLRQYGPALSYPYGGAGAFGGRYNGRNFYPTTPYYYGGSPGGGANYYNAGPSSSQYSYPQLSGVYYGGGSGGRPPAATYYGGPPGFGQGFGDGFGGGFGGWQQQPQQQQLLQQQQAGRRWWRPGGTTTPPSQYTSPSAQQGPPSTVPREFFDNRKYVLFRASELGNPNRKVAVINDWTSASPNNWFARQQAAKTWGVPETMRGVWWMSGNPLPGTLVSNAWCVWDGRKRTMQMKIAGPSWIDAATKEGLDSMKAAERFDYRYNIKFENPQFTKAHLEPVYGKRRTVFSRLVDRILNFKLEYKRGRNGEPGWKRVSGGGLFRPQGGNYEMIQVLDRYGNTVQRGYQAMVRDVAEKKKGNGWLVYKCEKQGCASDADVLVRNLGHNATVDDDEVMKKFDQLDQESSERVASTVERGNITEIATMLGLSVDDDQDPELQSELLRILQEVEDEEGGK